MTGFFEPHFTSKRINYLTAENDMKSETIRRVNGYEHDAYTYYPVVIIGAGASGIAMACQLKQQLGFDQFRVFDRQAGIGGTWWINRYPGIAW